MKKTTYCRSLSLLLALIMLCCVLVTACEDNQGDETSGIENTTAAPDTGTTPPADTTEAPPADETTAPPEGKINFTVELKTAGGMSLSDTTVFIYADSTLEDLEGYGVTDESGVATYALDATCNTYVAVISGLSDGYDIADSYPLTGSETKITLTSSVITDSSMAGARYKLGDVIHDFTVVTTDGETLRLSELLTEKKAVMLNFWFSTCSPCISEFPYMNSAYLKYQDELEIIALNHYVADSEDTIKLFKSSNSLSMPMAKDYTSLASALSVNSYPTSVIIDRYGVICMIEEGGITSEKPFTSAFKHFTAENYNQKIVSSIGEFIEIPKPNVEMPSNEEISSAVNSGDIKITYSSERSEIDKDSAWPFVLTEKDGAACIKNSNSELDDTFATIYADVELKAGQALAFDYFVSSEELTDILYVLVNKDDIYQISGQSAGWQTCYPWVATEDGVYELYLCYLKDESSSVGEDSVYLKNFRICSVSDITVPSYIPRNCATNRAEDGYGYENYASVVFNESDGYYHVGTKDGPLLLANLMMASAFSDASVFQMAYDGKIIVDGVNYYNDIVKYSTYSSNASIFGLCTVNEELCELLKKVAFAVGLESDNENEWLQMCMYYNVYGTTEELSDPIRGLADFSAIPAYEGKDNTIVYDRMIMPRGLWYRFTPTRSGAFRITSDSQYEVEAWIFTDNSGVADYTYDSGERMYQDDKNCSFVYYFEEGRNYYIDIAYYDVYQMGTITFEIKYLGESYEYFRMASPGYFTYYESEDDTIINEIVALGIDVVLCEDGYYHEKRADGSVGSILYADFTQFTHLFNTRTINEMIEMDGFNFKYSDDDLYILSYIEKYGDEFETKIRELWGEASDEYWEIYKVDEVLSGIYHGTGDDLTEEMRAYAKLAVETPDTPERSGCVAVDARLAELLQMLVDKYSFSGVDNAWTKLCYYYQYIGA